MMLLLFSEQRASSTCGPQCCGQNERSNRRTISAHFEEAMSAWYLPIESCVCANVRLFICVFDLWNYLSLNISAHFFYTLP
jgi:hypothetical protein